MTNPLVSQIFDGKSSLQINRICERSGVGRMTVDSWIKLRRTPRIDLLTAVANAVGFDLELVPKGKKMKTIKIVTRVGRIEAYLDNHVVGYVENDVLYGIDRKGFASEICAINHRVEISAKLIEWRKEQESGA